MPRQNVHEYYCDMLKLVATRGTCPRRQVAAILTDAQGRVLATGYNGVPSGYPHCVDERTRCPGAADAAGDTSRCVAIHAEQNVIVQAGLSGSLARAHDLYVSTSPCFTCCKLLCSLPELQNIFCLERYADASGLDLLNRRKILLFIKHDFGFLKVVA